MMRIACISPRFELLLASLPGGGSRTGTQQKNISRLARWGKQRDEGPTPRLQSSASMRFSNCGVAIESRAGTRRPERTGL